MKKKVAIVGLLWFVYLIHAGEGRGKGPSADTVSNVPLFSLYSTGQVHLQGELFLHNRNYDRRSWGLTYKIGTTITPVEHSSIHFELGNRWQILAADLSYYGSSRHEYDWKDVFVKLAYVRTDPGIVNISAGIIPVRESCLRGLLVIAESGYRYISASRIEWGLGDNFNKMGIRVGAPIIRGDVQIGMDVMYAVEPFWFNKVYEILAEVPIAVGIIRVIPELYLSPNYRTNWITGEHYPGIGGGFECEVKVNSTATLRGGLGYVQTTNYYGGAIKISGQYVQVQDTIEGIEESVTGLNSAVGATLNLGPGFLDVDFGVSTDRYSPKNVSVRINEADLFADVKYGYKIHKYCMIIPRCRFVRSIAEIRSLNISAICPELMINAAF